MKAKVSGRWEAVITAAFCTIHFISDLIFLTASFVKCDRILFIGDITKNVGHPQMVPLTACHGADRY